MGDIYDLIQAPDELRASLREEARLRKEAEAALAKEARKRPAWATITGIHSSWTQTVRALLTHAQQEPGDTALSQELLLGLCGAFLGQVVRGDSAESALAKAQAELEALLATGNILMRAGHETEDLKAKFPDLVVSSKTFLVELFKERDGLKAEVARLRVIIRRALEEAARCFENVSDIVPFTRAEIAERLRALAAREEVNRG